MRTPWWFLKIGAGLLLILHAVLHATGAGPWSSRFPVPTMAAQIVVLLGACLHLGHYVVLKRRVEDLSTPETLVTSGGLFGRVRHPMYLGDAVVYLGLVGLAADWVALTLYTVAVVSIVLQCRVEDRDLARRFGAAFDQWAARSRILLPFPRVRA